MGRDDSRGSGRRRKGGRWPDRGRRSTGGTSGFATNGEHLDGGGTPVPPRTPCRLTRCPPRFPSRRRKLSLECRARLTKLSMKTGAVWSCLAQSRGRPRTMARMREPELGMLIQGRMRNLGLSTTRGFVSHRCGVQAMKPPRGAGFHAAVLKPRTATGGPVTVVHGVAQPGAGQGLLADMAVAGDELVPQPPLARAARHRAPLEGADLVGGGREPGRFGAGSEDDGLGRCCRPQGGGSTITPSRCMATRAIMPLRPPSGLSRPMHRQNSWTTRRGSAVDRRRSGRAAAPSHGW